MCTTRNHLSNFISIRRCKSTHYRQKIKQCPKVGRFWIIPQIYSRFELKFHFRDASHWKNHPNKLSDRCRLPSPCRKVGCFSISPHICSRQNLCIFQSHWPIHVKNRLNTGNHLFLCIFLFLHKYCSKNTRKACLRCDIESLHIRQEYFLRQIQYNWYLDSLSIYCFSDWNLCYFWSIGNVGYFWEICCDLYWKESASNSRRLEFSSQHCFISN